MDSNHRCLGVGQESSPLDHKTMYPTRAEAVRLELTTGVTRTCFQDRPLIQPDDFQC